MYTHIYFEQFIHHLDSSDWAEFEQYLEDGWRLEEPIFISEDVKKQIASSSSFSATPIGAVKEHVVAEEFHNLMPLDFASSYIVNTCEDAAHLRKLLDEFNQPQPSILVYSYSTQRYNDLPMPNKAIVKALSKENPVIANLLVDHFGHHFSYMHGMKCTTNHSQNKNCICTLGMFSGLSGNVAAADCMFRNQCKACS